MDSRQEREATQREGRGGWLKAFSDLGSRVRDHDHDHDHDYPVGQDYCPRRRRRNFLLNFSTRPALSTKRFSPV